jgi:hypothetical protein
MNSYIFITTEGHTFQPETEAVEPDIENCQVIGFADGLDPQQAFENLLRDNIYLLQTTFNELTCYELKNGYRNASAFFLLRKDECLINHEDVEV